jgi:hypothetical protein
VCYKVRNFIAFYNRRLAAVMPSWRFSLCVLALCVAGCTTQPQNAAQSTAPTSDESFALGVLVEACFENTPSGITHVDCLKQLAKDPKPYLGIARDLDKAAAPPGTPL